MDWMELVGMLSMIHSLNVDMTGLLNNRRHGRPDRPLEIPPLHFNQAPVPITVAPDFVGMAQEIAQEIDDHAAVLNVFVHGRVRMSSKLAAFNRFKHIAFR